MADPENPLIKALPPEIDYISYLTIVEYNLTEEQLPLLHSILRDNPTLTTNIGWDLVHLLVPFLPASRECLEDVAQLGNPREVILKVTEALEIIRSQKSDEDDDQSFVSSSGEANEDEEAPSLEPHAVEDGEANEGKQTANTLLIKFEVLLQMLSTLHQRIKTAYPSRFLSTSLQAIIPAYAKVAHLSSAIESLISFVKSVVGPKKPPLPPRNGGSVQHTANDASRAAPDPEACLEDLSPEEAKLQDRLICSFITHVVERYIDSIPAMEDVPGLAWTSRFQEKRCPEKLIPHRQTMEAMFADNDELKRRDEMVLQISGFVSISLSNQIEDLNWILTHSDIDLEGSDILEHSDVFATDLPPSRIGLLYILANDLYAGGSLTKNSFRKPVKNSVKTHASMMRSYIDDANVGSAGTERQAVIDALLLFGFMSLQEIYPDTFASEEEFFEYLQRLCLLSANTPSPSLRYHAHVLVSTILHAHPSEQTRYTFIKDTLEHCPFENLKVSAVGWFKEELLAAGRTESQTEDKDQTAETPSSKEPISQQGSNFFLDLDTLSSLCPFLFPSIESAAEDLTVLQMQLPFYLAVLNLYYLMCSSPLLLERLEISKLEKHYDVVNHFINPLAELASKFRRQAETGDRLVSDSAEVLTDLQLLEVIIEQVRQARQS